MDEATVDAILELLAGPIWQQLEQLALAMEQGGSGSHGGAGGGLERRDGRLVGRGEHFYSATRCCATRGV